MPVCHYSNEILCEKRTHKTCKSKCKFITKEVKPPLVIIKHKIRRMTHNTSRLMISHRICGTCHSFNGSFERCSKSKLVTYNDKGCHYYHLRKNSCNNCYYYIGTYSHCFDNQTTPSRMHQMCSHYRYEIIL